MDSRQHPVEPLQSFFESTRVFESTPETTRSLADVPGLKSTDNIDLYANFIVSAVDKVIPKSKSERSVSQSVSAETVALIMEKRRLRQQYSQ